MQNDKEEGEGEKKYFINDQQSEPKTSQSSSNLQVKKSLKDPLFTSHSNQKNNKPEEQKLLTHLPPNDCNIQIANNNKSNTPPKKQKVTIFEIADKLSSILKECPKFENISKKDTETINMSVIDIPPLLANLAIGVNSHTIGDVLKILESLNKFKSSLPKLDNDCPEKKYIDRLNKYIGYFEKYTAKLKAKNNIQTIDNIHNGLFQPIN